MYKILLFVVWFSILREAAESAKYVMTNENLDRQLGGQSSAPYKSLKTCSVKGTNELSLMNTNCHTTKLTGWQMPWTK